MNLFLSLFFLILAVLAWVFYDKFTKRGAVPLRDAFRSYTAWLSAVGAVFGQYIADLFAWAAQQVDFLQAQFGGLLTEPSLGKFIQILSGLFLLLRLKGQGLPGLPDLPDPTDVAGADRP